MSPDGLDVSLGSVDHGKSNESAYTAPRFRDIKSNFGLVDSIGRSATSHLSAHEGLPAASPLAASDKFGELVHSDANGEIPNTLPVPDKTDDDITYHCKPIVFDLCSPY